MSNRVVVSSCAHAQEYTVNSDIISLFKIKTKVSMRSQFTIAAHNGLCVYRRFLVAKVSERELPIGNVFLKIKITYSWTLFHKKCEVNCDSFVK